MVYLGPQQCKKASCFLDGNILLDIEEINFDDIDPATEDVRFRAGEIKTIDVELKGRGIQSKARKPNAQLEIRLPIKDDVQAIWKFRGLLTRKQDTLTSATTLKLGAHLYEHYMMARRSITSTPRTSSVELTGMICWLRCVKCLEFDVFKNTHGAGA